MKDQEFPYGNFYEMLQHNARHSGAKKIIYTEDRAITNSELLRYVDRLSAFLHRKGVTHGDKVAIYMPNSEYFIVALFAITKLGAVAVPVNNFLKHEELEYILKNAHAKLLVSASTLQKELQTVFSNTGIEHIVWTDGAPKNDAANTDLETILQTPCENVSSAARLHDLAVLIYTSGTTGHPKGAMLSYKNIFSNSILGSKRLGANAKDRFILYLPMFHSFTLSIMIVLPLYNNSSMVIVKSVFPFSNVLKQVLLKRVTIFLGIPTIYGALAKAKIPWYFRFFHKIRLFISSSAPLSENVYNRFMARFPKAKMLEGYGLSECSPAVSVNPLEKQKILSVGTPLEGYAVKVVDEELLELPVGEVGELIVKGDCVMQGYYENEEATANTIVNGWLKTGDLAKVDEEGYIYIVDRKKDLIISKGINVYPREIEELLYKLDGVDAAAVVGVPDEKQDEIIVAFIQMQEGIPALQARTVHAYLKQHLANYKLPKHIYFIEELPRNATNKVLKRKLKENIDRYLPKEA